MGHERSFYIGVTLWGKAALKQMHINQNIGRLGVGGGVFG